MASLRNTLFLLIVVFCYLNEECYSHKTPKPSPDRKKARKSSLLDHKKPPKPSPDHKRPPKPSPPDRKKPPKPSPDHKKPPKASPPDRKKPPKPSPPDRKKIPKPPPDRKKFPKPPPDQKEVPKPPPDKKDIPQPSNLHHPGPPWTCGKATWYGNPTGCGSEGGACGYKDAISKPPLSSMITAVGPALYQNGKECGACYEVKCDKHKACSGKPVRVVVTDSCGGCDATHFDLSGTAYGAMAHPDQCEDLRKAGEIPIDFRRVPCHYSRNIEFVVEQGANPYCFSTVIEYEEGDGDLARVELKEGNKEWRPMQQSFGAVWKLDTGGTKLEAPFSIRWTSQLSGKTVEAKYVIPKEWIPGATYRSLVNFH